MLRVVFMGTPEFALPALNSIHQAHTIVGVYTQPDRPVGRGLTLKASPVKARALELGLKVFQPTKLSLPGEFDKLEALRPDVIVVVAFGQILRKNVLDLPSLGCINVHSSLLPRWRGAGPIQWAILAGDKETGVTTMHLVEKLDAGAILLQKKTEISENDTATTVHDRLAKMGGELILPTLEGLSKGTLKGQIQDESQVTYAKKLNKEMGELNPSEPAEVLGRKVRALNPWPGVSVDLEPDPKDSNTKQRLTKQRLMIRSARVWNDIQGERPGELFERAGMLLLSTSKGSLELLQIQREGKKPNNAAEFINGLRGKGQSLPKLRKI